MTICPSLWILLRMEINRQGFNTHLMIDIGGLKFERNDKDEVVALTLISGTPR